ncbi:FAD synthetase family protein [Siminovitchia acidinfaciens]|uniref:FAD synthase n=1 Tax=Siminovitchia acidinfaciens TaxID=2321395 RepID=A0A429Y6T2_9BACI|nr:FAD synthetase family protein [Siminovitchia acidinfaciens]RST77141.1 FAD synthetase family protein [Siminovitchia acidinfaciens]
MRIYSCDTLNLTASVLVIGAFDGVHRGHQQLIRQAKTQADWMQVPLVVYTFDPPPRVHFQKKLQLASLPVKLERLQRLDVDHTVVAPFDSFYASREAKVFLNEIRNMNPLSIWVGKDFKFGVNRNGDIDTLKQNFHVNSLDLVCCQDGEIISSTRIRHLIANNMTAKAEQLLGWQTVNV